MTFTSSPPRRRAVRQQSIAVFPPPSTITRLADLARVLKRDAAEPVDADVNIRRAFLAAGKIGRSRPRGAPVPTKTAS